MALLSTFLIVCLVTTVFTGFFSANLVLIDWWASKLYAAGYLKRRSKSMTKDKKEAERQSPLRIWENAVRYWVTVVGVVIYIVHKALPVLDKVDYSFKVVETWASLCLIYITFDFLYYFTHRFVHEVPVLYQSIHKRHHEDIPVDAYTTGHAELLENFIFTFPGVLVWAVLYMNTVDVPNAWAITLPVLSLTSDFAMVHVGYFDNILLNVLNPLSYIMQLSLGARQMYARHELHHLAVKKNYGPMLPYWDMIFGTQKEVVEAEWGLTAQGEKSQ
ncbi:hypothetical protein SpCBS45565_g04000 [Spizellomyces sp. 'palustris']|nr:hypothetical protein SpCBS45565_g04000 [Spizellomyces sp. 'palustris']